VSRRRHTCPGPACGRGLQSWERLCGRCWKLLPLDYRKAIIDARAARNELAVSEHARSAVAWLADHSPAAIAARQLGEHPP
jgi:hypothetical protein